MTTERTGHCLSIASGKGGTGKTLVATNLSAVSGARLADLDVEAPNCHLFHECQSGSSEAVYRQVPQVDTASCDLCGECARACLFGAILRLPDRLLLQEDVCHSCGACQVVCPRQAVSMRPRKTGSVVHCHYGDGDLLYGRLRIGEPSPVPLIRAMKSCLQEGSDAVLDCPPGTGCAVLESMRDSDLCLMVTEPTVFGLHDLRLAVKLARKLELPVAVVINKDGLPGTDIVPECQDMGLEILARIPFSRGIAESYAQGHLLCEKDEYRKAFLELWRRCQELMGP
ncbi:MAG: ATP-binding protein [Methanomassiliicoccales archaeon]|nr:ATP-binding protein [Methanomassiliicoccales archaeon]